MKRYGEEGKRRGEGMSGMEKREVREVSAGPHCTLLSKHGDAVRVRSKKVM